MMENQMEKNIEHDMEIGKKVSNMIKMSPYV